MGGGDLIITVYQTSGTCDTMAMQTFVTNFLSQMMSGSNTGTNGSGMGTGTTGSSTGTGSSGTGTATPTP
jgi:hypothetical protein